MFVSHIHPPPTSALGYIGGVHAIRVSGRSYVQLLPSRPEAPLQSKLAPEWRSRDFDARVADAGRIAWRTLPVTTLILCTPTRTASEELAAAAACALYTLDAALAQSRPRVLPGAGCIETLLSNELRRGAESAAGARAVGLVGARPRGEGTDVGDGSGGVSAARRLDRQLCLLLADAFDEPVVALAGGGLGGRDAVERLASESLLGGRHDGSNLTEHDGSSVRSSLDLSYWGWDVEAAKPSEMMRVAWRRGGSDGREGGESLGDESFAGSAESESGAVQSGCEHAYANPDGRLEVARLVELESEKVDSMRCAVELACAVMAADKVVVDTR